jgi:hypothetical protein
MKNLYFLIFFCVGFNLSAQNIEKFSIDSGGANITNGNIQLLYTLGETHVQEVSVNSIILSEGFINPQYSGTLSIGDKSVDGVLVFPNPVSQTLYISTNQTLESVSLYEILGKEVYASKHSNHIDVSRYQQGIYLLKIETNRGFITKKIIIK